MLLEDAENGERTKELDGFHALTEFARCFGDTTTVVAKADACIRSLLQELDTLRARSQPVDINAEQNCSFVELKYLSLAADFSALQSCVFELESDKPPPSSPQVSYVSLTRQRKVFLSGQRRVV
ncbi:hypothetical protein PIB30_012595 [Stylosanthes scabra]|uniref:Uncharacterized protein n=1 Tax=Stylosanthes scabra TaxID=79078 RepID=A0ABU6X5S5_9FABA|nr:hypothetical protein [Stylosanthes scabra]